METQTGPRKKSFWREVLGYAGSLLFAVVVAFLVITFVFQFIMVDGESMINTLQDGERMFVTKYQYYFAAPQRFDVVVCHFPNRGDQYFVKRIVGIPGDTLAVEGGRLYLNGEPVQEDYIDYPPNYRMLETTVPEDSYFVLGDNRANSNDSHVIGPLERQQIVGKVRAIVWPLSSWRAVH